MKSHLTYTAVDLYRPLVHTVFVQAPNPRPANFNPRWRRGQHPDRVPRRDRVVQPTTVNGWASDWGTYVGRFGLLFLLLANQDV